jgi:tRNA A-37 threonylcarbamoyl transferase component Bud32
MAKDPFGLSGTVLERKYRVDRVVAEGGFGVVYTGHHLGLDVPIAVKVLKRVGELSSDVWHDLLSRFVQEAKTMAKLRHPNVVAVLDTGVAELDAGSVPWMVMEWIEGETLRDDLAARRGQPGRTPVECLALMRPIMQAIADAHEAGIAHRDIKPTNILLERTKRGIVPRVLDFGIAKLMEGEESALASGQTTTQGSFKAFSASHAAPEQVAGTRTGPWTDVHALALIVTELLTNRPPYAAEDATEQAAQVFDAKRPSPAKHGVDAGAWEAVLLRALAVKPQERHASAGDLLADLEASLAGAKVAALAGQAPQPLPAGAEVSATTATPVSTERRQRTTAATPAARAKSRRPLYVAVAVTLLAGAGAVIAVRQIGGDRSGAATLATPSGLPPAPATTTLPSPSASVAAPLPESSDAGIAAVDASGAGPRVQPPVLIGHAPTARPSARSSASAAPTVKPTATAKPYPLD